MVALFTLFVPELCGFAAAKSDMKKNAEKITDKNFNIFMIKHLLKIICDNISHLIKISNTGLPQKTCIIFEKTVCVCYILQTDLL